MSVSGCIGGLIECLENACNRLNLLTEIHLQHYSDRMNSEFNALSEKIDKLAELTQFLRRENAELRLKIAAMSSENAILTAKMQQAHQRVSALLEQIPDPLRQHNEESA